MPEQIINETWKIIKDFPDYAVSNYGRVKRVTKDSKNRTYPGKILKAFNNKFGYIHLMLYKNKKSYMPYVHRLVLKAFGSPCPKGFQCNHKDGNKANNKVKNLEWVTAKENLDHRINVLGKTYQGEKCHLHKLTEKEVQKIRKLRKEENFTQDKIAKMFNVGRANISYIILRKTWKHI